MTTYAARHVDIWPWTNWYSAVGTPTRNLDSSALGGGYVATAGAQNNEIVWNVPLDAGTWTLTAIYRKMSAYGIATFYLDATSLGTVDTYAASASNNNVSQITGITVATPAVYALKMKAETKNASASQYFLVMNLLTLTRTGA